MPPEDRTAAATRALLAARQGDPSAVARLLPLVYEDLRAIARRYLDHERSGHTLQPTALVHEAFLRLFGAEGVQPSDRTHFLSVAAVAMRRILVEHARARAADKRGGNERRVTLDSRAAIAGESEVDVLALDEALQRLAALDERQARVVELRFFGGLSMDEVAALLGVSKRSAEADWTLARTWLHHELSR
jgi:RNA polymerase sigma factor (TIGR02999 family)